MSFFASQTDKWAWQEIVNFSSMLYMDFFLRYNNKNNSLEGDIPVASEYLLKKYKDVKPDEPIQLTEKEKRQNWWHYHRIHVLVGVVILGLIGSFIWELVSKEEPDYQVAYIGEYAPPFDSEDNLEAILEARLPDRDGDGKVSVQVNSYVINDSDPNAYASQVALAGDIYLGSSSVFIVEDPMEAQSMYGIFYQEDGSVPEDEADVQSCESYAWKDCPVVSSLDLGMELYVIHRGFMNEELRAANEGVEALWEVITEGAVK